MSEQFQGPQGQKRNQVWDGDTAYELPAGVQADDLDNPAHPLHGGHPPSRPALEHVPGVQQAEPVERPADWPHAPVTENPDEHHFQADEHPPKPIE